MGILTGRATKMRRFLRLGTLFGGGLLYRVWDGVCWCDLWGFPMHVGRKDVVLEIGAGAHPRIRSDILAEKYFDDRLEGRPKRVDDRPYLIADGANIPLADASVDYVICCHVLEHVDDPAKMLEELKRVARKGGYVSTPSKHKELASPASYHQWLVEIDKGVLTLTRKRSALETAEIPDPRLRAEIRYEWDHMSHPLRYSVVDPNKEPVAFPHARFSVPQSIGRESATGPRLRMLRWLRRLYQSTSTVDITGSLRCPICGRGVTADSNRASCTSGHVFPVVDGIPVLVEDASLPQG